MRKKVLWAIRYPTGEFYKADRTPKKQFWEPFSLYRTRGLAEGVIKRHDDNSMSDCTIVRCTLTIEEEVCHDHV